MWSFLSASAFASSGQSRGHKVELCNATQTVDWSCQSGIIYGSENKTDALFNVLNDLHCFVPRVAVLV